MRVTLHGQDWERFLAPYEQAVEELKVKFRAMRAELKHNEEYSPIEFVTGRVKKVSSILEKAKRLHLSTEQLEEVPDIAGLRVMVQFVDDIDRVVQLIRQRDGKDLRIVEEKDYISHQKESGYQSYHFVLLYPVQTASGQKDLLVEVQIRTLAMNFWATIEHSLNYKYKEGIPEALRERLRRAADAAYQLDNEMSEIREEIQDAQRLFASKSDLVNRILSDIERLYLIGAVSEALELQQRVMNAAGSHEMLIEVSEQVQEALSRMN